jgi:hypothetical protein
MRLATTALALLALACSPGDKPMTDAERTAVSDSAGAVMDRVFAAANRLDFETAWKQFSTDSDARFAENGMIYPSLDSIRTVYRPLLPTFDSLVESVTSRNIQVLDRETAVVTLAVALHFKPRNKAAFDANFAWSGVIQRRSGAWKIVQAHESFPDPVALGAAVAPADSTAVAK